MEVTAGDNTLTNLDEILLTHETPSGTCHFIYRVARYEFVRLQGKIIVQRIDLGWKYDQAKDRYLELIRRALQLTLNLGRND